MDSGSGLRAAILLAALVVVFAGLRMSEALVVPLLLAGCVAAATAPASRWLSKRGVPNSAAVSLVIVGVIAALAAFSMLVGLVVGELRESLPRYEAAIGTAQAELAQRLEGDGQGELAEAVRTFRPRKATVGLVSVAMSGVPSLVSILLVVLLVVVFVLLEAASFPEKVRAIGLDEDGAAARTVREVQRYLRIKTAISVVTGASVAGLTAMLGVPHALLWGLLAFALNYVPQIGSAVAAVPAVLVAWADCGGQTAIAVATGYVVINFTLGTLIEPRWMGRALGLSPLVVILSVIFWGWLLGPIGALVSAPLTMIVKIVLANTQDLRWVAVLLGPAREREEITGAAGRAENADAAPIWSPRLEDERPIAGPN